MIVSHRHRFIFVKTAKTAGSSVELYLRQFCGPDDIVPYLVPDDERLARSIGAGRPRNHGIRRLMPWEICSEILADARRRRKWPKHRRYRNHQRANEIPGLIGDVVWREYRKITIVRDPWDTTVSRYYWPSKRRAEDPVAALDEAVEFYDKAVELGVATLDEDQFIDLLRESGVEVDVAGESGA